MRVGLRPVALQLLCAGRGDDEGHCAPTSSNRSVAPLLPKKDALVCVHFQIHIGPDRVGKRSSVLRASS